MARHPSTPPSARLSADADALYERITPLLGRWSERTVVTGEHGPVLPGTVLGDRDWLADRVADADARWNCPDSRTAATLWWYSASVTVVAGWPAAALTGADGPDMDPARLRLTLTDYGYLRALRSDRAVPTAASSAGHRALISEIIAGLAAVSGASERALHAIASASLAGRLVDAVAGGIAPDAAGRCAEELFTAPLIRPRFLDLTTGADGTAVAEKVALSAPVPTAARRVVRRCSCCLIYQAPGENRCRNCPRRTAAEKAEGWARMLADR